MANLHEQLAAIDGPESFLEFVRALASDRRAAPGQWENATIEAFLEAATSWAEDSAWGATQGLGGANPWRTFATFLYCGKITNRAAEAMAPYQEQFPVGSEVRVADRAVLEHFRRTWRFHNPLTVEQLAFAAQVSTVRNVSFYHGGDALYILSDVPGVWHERLLSSCLTGAA
jgi:hypothetical protein